MGAITTIIVADALSTPVNHTFNPISVEGGKAVWKEQSNAAASGFWPCVLSYRTPLPGQSEKLYRVSLNLGIPTVVSETINGVSNPLVARTGRASVEFVLPESSTLQERKDLRKILVGLLDNVLVKATIEDLTPVY